MQISSAKDIFCAIILLVFEFAWQTNGKFGTEFAIRLLRQAKSESARRKSQLKSALTRATKARFACHTEPLAKYLKFKKEIFRYAQNDKNFGIFAFRRKAQNDKWHGKAAQKSEPSEQGKKAEPKGKPKSQVRSKERATQAHEPKSPLKKPSSQQGKRASQKRVARSSCEKISPICKPLHFTFASQSPQKSRAKR